MSLLYISANALFVWKYAPEYLSRPGLALAAYVAGIIIVLWALFKSESITGRFRVSGAGYFTFVCMSAILLDILMLQFDPARIAVGRYPAISEWLGRLFNGEFPYTGTSGANPSGFPFLYALFMPFYLLGDLGFMQIACYIIFASMLYDWHGRDGARALRSLVLLLISPAFLYEIVVRSELFSNMALVILYLHLLGKYGGRKCLAVHLGSVEKVDFVIARSPDPLQRDGTTRQSPFSAQHELRSPRPARGGPRDDNSGRVPTGPLVWGLVAGLLLSTRGIVLPIYLVFFAFMFKKDNLRSASFYFMIAVGFVVTLLPFIIWNAERFLISGPFAIQASYIPLWLLALAIAVSIVSGIRSISLSQVYAAIALILFAVILVPFVVAVASLGFAGAVRGDGFDISYFCFVLPFVIFAFRGHGAQKASAVAHS